MLNRTFFAVLALAVCAFSQTPAQDSDLLKDVYAHPAMKLENFDRLAAQSNPTVALAETLARQSAAQARQAGLYPNPSVGYQGEQIRGGAYRGGEQGGFIQQTFVLGGKLGLRRDVFEQQRRVDEISTEEQRRRVLSDVGQLFYSALAAQELVNAQRRLFGLAADAVTTAHQLANVGQADEPDVLQAEVEAGQAGVDYLTAQRMYLQMFHKLSAAAGQPDLPVSPLDGDLEHPPQIDTAKVMHDIVESSPMLKRARQEVLRAQAELKSAGRELVPDLQVHAGLQNNLEPLGSPGSPAVGVQGFVTAGISLPVFNRNQGNIAAANASVTRAQAEVARLGLSLRQETEPYVQSYLSAGEQAHRYKNDLLPRAERAYRLYLAKYQEMAAAYPQVLVSQRTYFQLQISYIRVLEDWWRNAILLQNYGLTAGLSAPVSSGVYGDSYNPPGASGSSAP